MCRVAFIWDLDDDPDGNHWQICEEETISDNKNKGDKVGRKVQWTAEDRARHQAIRDMFRDWHPSPEELIASGEAANFDLHGEYRELRPFS